uniref:Sushi domain-containing protein n=1 Tax=Panagrolaimus davidi TaxID=227884 RepID=A0A914QV69_9BILA
MPIGVLHENLLNDNPCLQAPSRPIEGELKFSTMSTTGPWSTGTTAELICKLPYISQGEIKSICSNGIFSPLGNCILPPANNNLATITQMDKIQ